MNIDFLWCGFLKLVGVGVVVILFGVMGFGEVEVVEVVYVCVFKLVLIIEVCNICIYCLVVCGILIYVKGDVVVGEKVEIVYIEGDVDYLMNCGMLCFKGVVLKDIVYVVICLIEFCICRFGVDWFELIGWDEVLDKIVCVLKDDCDVNMVLQNDVGVMVNCWISIGFLVVFVIMNEIVWLIYKMVCVMGIVGFDNQVCV